MTRVPRAAMVLAAGRGERLRPLTDTTPKPLVRVRDRSMLDRLLDALAAAGVERAVVNAWHMAGAIEAALRDRRNPVVTISREDTLLDTGGGTLRALPLLGADPFFVTSAKMVWRDGPVPALARLAAAWHDRRMDALLLLQPTGRALGFDGPGDFLLDGDGRIAWRGAAAAAPFAYTSLQIVHPRLFAGAPSGAFSFHVLWDKAIADHRAFGLVHDGAWCHVSTPEGLRLAEAGDWDG